MTRTKLRDTKHGSPREVSKLTESGEDRTTNDSGKDMVVSYVHLDEDDGGEVQTKNVSHYHSQGHAEHTSLHSSKRSTEFWSQHISMPRAKSDPALPSCTGDKEINRLDCMNEASYSLRSSTVPYQERSSPYRQLTAETEKTEFHARPTVMKMHLVSYFGDGLKRFLWVVVLLIVVILSMLVMHVTNNTDTVMEKDFSTLMEDVKSAYPSQQEQLWKKSLIHLQQNLRATNPTEPVNMILTAGRSAEKTLRCLAGHLAAAFLSGANASILHIDGASWSALDSDEAKLAIDYKLRGAFESKMMAAVIHRFEELPPGSALVFYRYCDHENAAYKGVLLVFTVLLPVEALDPTLSLIAVEEMVHDHIQDRFRPSALPGTFNQMDLDQFGGLWNQIAHLVLPMVAEEQMEKNGCNN